MSPLGQKSKKLVNKKSPINKKNSEDNIEMFSYKYFKNLKDFFWNSGQV